jgi:hypothetical protein
MRQNIVAAPTAEETTAMTARERRRIIAANSIRQNII